MLMVQPLRKGLFTTNRPNSPPNVPGFQLRRPSEREGGVCCKPELGGLVEAPSLKPHAGRRATQRIRRPFLPTQSLVVKIDIALEEYFLSGEAVAQPVAIALSETSLVRAGRLLLGYHSRRKRRSHSRRAAESRGGAALSLEPKKAR